VTAQPAFPSLRTSQMTLSRREAAVGAVQMLALPGGLAADRRSMANGKRMGEGAIVADLHAMAHGIAPPTLIGSGRMPGGVGELSATASGAMIGRRLGRLGIPWTGVEPDHPRAPVTEADRARP